MQLALDKSSEYGFLLWERRMCECLPDYRPRIDNMRDSLCGQVIHVKPAHYLHGFLDYKLNIYCRGHHKLRNCQMERTHKS